MSPVHSHRHRRDDRAAPDGHRSDDAQQHRGRLPQRASGGAGNLGTSIDVAIGNGQTLQFGFTNTAIATSWSGTATLTNLSDANTVLDTFAFTLVHTGTGGGGGGGSGGGEGPPP